MIIVNKAIIAMIIPITFLMIEIVNLIKPFLPEIQVM